MAQEEHTGRIRLMPDQLANQIAAGEVVERPASVVKELVENSLDAEATRVEVDIEVGGQQLIRVTDDGHGMGPEDAALCLQRHATSKIRSVEDLRAIGTLGFRGEALPSIASVSRLQVESRPPEALAGLRVSVEGGGPLTQEEIGLPRGTRVTVRDLFFNVPARRKFLRSIATEAGRIHAEMTRFALGYPHVRFRLTHNGRKVLDVTPERRLENRAYAVLGRQVAESLHPVSLRLGVEVEGLVSAPGLHRVNADGMYTFVNGRFIRDRLVQHAITAAYGGLLDRGRYPYVVLFLRLSPELIDVNVHPAKSEVRFVRAGEVHETITRALKMTLAEAPWLGTAAGEDGVRGRISSPTARGPVPTNAELPLPPSRPASSVSESPPPYTTRPPVGRVLRELEILPAEGPGLPSEALRDHESAEETAAPPGFFSRMRYVGQVNRMFLLCESPEALHVIDQHAAHERVTFERLRAGFESDEVPVQNLLFPVLMELSPAEVAAVEAHEEGLGRLGFDVVAFGPQTLSVRAVPAFLGAANYTSLIRDLVAELLDLGHSRALADRVEAIVARIACHGSVRGGDAMTEQEVRELLRQLDEVDFAGNCPHGRPVVVTHRFAEVARWFERS